MKRKKWSEVEEQSLLSKYSELLRSGTLAKLKTREKKFKPVADHVNAVHHLRDPTTFPFKWSWRDVSIKVQNMRHQYLGVKQKIQLSPHHFNWKDGPNHWENFLNYKEVFGDVQLDPKSKKQSTDSPDLGFGIASDSEDEEEEEEEEEEETEDEEDDDNDHDDDGDNNDDTDVVFSEDVSKKLKVKRLVSIGAEVLELKEAVVKREERRREREFRKEKVELEKEWKRKEVEFKREKRRSERGEWLEDRELELEERQLRCARKEFEKRVRLERELQEERRWRKRVEEKMEEEEMEWRQRMVEMQVQHEKNMMQMHVEACQNQMQILGIMARLLCQFFGSGSDGLGTLPSQVLQHSGGLDNVKPDANSPSEFM